MNGQLRGKNFHLRVEHPFRGALHDTATDPRRAVAAALAPRNEGSGSIVAYSASTERKCLQSLAAVAGHDDALVLRRAAGRLVDPLDVMRRPVYDPAICGESGLKVVTPALLGPEYSYEGHAIRGGTDATVRFEELTYPACAPVIKQTIRRELLGYCAQDTGSTLHLVRWFETEAAKA